MTAEAPDPISQSTQDATRASALPRIARCRASQSECKGLPNVGSDAANKAKIAGVREALLRTTMTADTLLRLGRNQGTELITQSQREEHAAVLKKGRKLLADIAAEETKTDRAPAPTSQRKESSE